MDKVNAFTLAPAAVDDQFPATIQAPKVDRLTRLVCKAVADHYAKVYTKTAIKLKMQL